MRAIVFCAAVLASTAALAEGRTGCAAIDNPEVRQRCELSERVFRALPLCTRLKRRDRSPCRNDHPPVSAFDALKATIVPLQPEETPGAKLYIEP